MTDGIKFCKAGKKRGRPWNGKVDVKGLERKLKRSLECLNPEDQSRRAIKGHF